VNPFPKFRLIQDAAERDRVIAAARADNDSIIHPSHLLERGGEIIGAASMAVVPLVMVWNDSRKISARDSLHLTRIYDAHMEAKGFKNFVMACNRRSPYNPHMKKLGYLPVWETEIFVGGVANP
jgi:hypothetical protein